MTEEQVKEVLINISKIEQILMDRSISAYRLSKEIGIQESSISLLRSGKKNFTRMTIETAIKVQEWLDAGNDPEKCKK